MSKNILLLGSGGRECAFAYKISQSTQLGKLFIAPGNAGTQSYGTNVAIKPTDFKAIGEFSIENNIDLVVVGPEDPLVKGVRNYFLADDSLKHIPVLGPSAEAALLEGSKSFSKDFMKKYNVPTAAYLEVSANNIAEGCAFLDTLTAPYVLKADGLAAGKGVLILDNLEEAKAELREMIECAKFGEASSRVVIEEYLSGIECSVFVATDSKNYCLLPTAKDYKRIGEGDSGLNTGGMGAVSPVPFANEEFMTKVVERIVEPTVKGIEAEGLDYHGFIFIGLMNCGGDPYVIEYNVRMGDPETEVVLPRIQSDILELLFGIVEETLNKIELKLTSQTALTVVCTSAGYPGDYPKGLEIAGLDQKFENSTVFHAGTSELDGKTLTAGGRVLAVTSMASTIEEARDKSYSTIDSICYEGIYFRRDIGLDLLEYV